MLLQAQQQLGGPQCSRSSSSSFAKLCMEQQQGAQQQHQQELLLLQGAPQLIPLVPHWGLGWGAPLVGSLRWLVDCRCTRQWKRLLI